MKTKLIMTIVFSLITTTVCGESQGGEQAHGVDTFTINKQTLSSGGGLITGGIYSVIASIGQLDAGHQAIGGIYKVKGGFLIGNSDLIFKNGFE